MSVKKCFIHVLILGVLLVALPADAKVDFQIDYANRFIWRGFDLNPNNHYVIQPSVNYAFPESRWSANLWYSRSAQDHTLNEIDLTFNYDFITCEDIALSAGVIHYGWYWANNYSSKANTSLETYIRCEWSKVALTPTISIYHDSKNGNGLYAQLALAKTIKLNDKQDLELSSTIGYNQKQWISRSGLSDVTFTVGLPIKSGDTTITPFYSISWPLIDAINPGVSNEHWLGLTVAF